jgi:hypothetical protein
MMQKLGITTVLHCNGAMSADVQIRTTGAAIVRWGTGLPIMKIGTNLVGIQAMHEGDNLLCNLIIEASVVSLP